MIEAAYRESDKLIDLGLLPNTDFARVVHDYALRGAEGALGASDASTTSGASSNDAVEAALQTFEVEPEDLVAFRAVSPFHWRAAAAVASASKRYAAGGADARSDAAAEILWNAVMANVAVTGEFFWRSQPLAALKELQAHSDRARQLANFNYCFWNPTIEAFVDCLMRPDMTALERLIISYGEACCYAVRQDEERFEHAAEKFTELLANATEDFAKPAAVPSLAAPVLNLIQLLRQFSKAASQTTERLQRYLSSVRQAHESPYTRLHAELLQAEDKLIWDYWSGTIYRKIDWTLQALNTLSYAILAGVSTHWYGYLQYVLAQRSSYSGIYDVAREMIRDLERQHSPYAQGANGYYLAELEDFDQSAHVYEAFLRIVEQEQSSAHRGEREQPPVVRKSDMAFCYYYAAQSLFHIRADEEDVRSMHGALVHVEHPRVLVDVDNATLCAEMIEKFFVWSQYLSFSARNVLNEICLAMQAELNDDLATAVTYYERYLAVLSGDDYISRIKTLSRMAQIYAEDLKNFDKADEHLQSLKKLLPKIQKNSALPFQSLNDETAQPADSQANGSAGQSSQNTQETTVQLWLTNYSLKATQKVLSALDTVTSQLASAYQLVEEQNNELTNMNQRLVDLNQEKNEFMGIAAHDLKSPLSGIILAVDMLDKYLNRMTFDQRTKKLQDVRHTAQRMSAIITNLLDINAIETGKFNFSLSSFNFADAVFKVVDDYRERASVKNIVLHYEAEDEYAEAFADPNATMEILDNLVSNAVKYSPPDKQVFVRVRVGAISAPAFAAAPAIPAIPAIPMVRCEIEDQGPGLSEEDKSKLFGKFVRLSAKPTGGEHSTGLGLSIVKKLAETMGGTVWCESERDQGKLGATFVVALPQQARQSIAVPVSADGASVEET
jgi:signal transduction histidine kinase